MLAHQGQSGWGVPSGRDGRPWAGSTCINCSEHHLVLRAAPGKGSGEGKWPPRELQLGLSSLLSLLPPLFRGAPLEIFSLPILSPRRAGGCGNSFPAGVGALCLASFFRG